MVAPTSGGGNVPVASEVLTWLFSFSERHPTALDEPSQILDLATREGFAPLDGRHALAARLLRLIDEGYLQGEVPALAHATPTRRLAETAHLQLSMKAFGLRDASTAPGPRSVVNIVAGQVALGDIANYVTFGDVLITAEREVDDLTEDEATRGAAKQRVRPH
jgi:hypothetical protein